MLLYNSYDAAGHLLSVTDANNVTTEFTYHARGWLLTSRVKNPSNSNLDALTIYNYDAVGQLISMTLPNGYHLNYEYDDAKRLKAIKNVNNERIEYQSDAAGNRTQEVIKDGSGTIQYSVARAYDELSRIIKLNGNHQQQQVFSYDPNDNNTQVTDNRNNSTSQQFDALNRLAKVIDPALGQTQYTYNAQNQIKTVTDARGTTTSYTYDGFGNLLNQTSPDTGTTTFTYDAAGNRLSATDARGVVVNYTYDALNRLLTVRYPAASSENVNYTYDDASNGNYGVGRLTGVVNTGAGLAYRYNNLGLISQKVTQVNGLPFTTAYSYDLAGNLNSITYPSGRTVTYLRDTLGRVQAMKTKATATALEQTIASDIRYLPFGPANSYTLGNGLTHSATYDSDYRLTAIQVGSILNRNYNFDAVDNITNITDNLASSKSQDFTYDALNRLTSADGIYGYQAFSYDAVGNRTGLLSDNGTTVLNDTYIYPATNNRLSSINKTTNGAASGTRSFTYDAAGNRIQGTTEANTVQNYTYNKANRLTTAKVATTTLGTYAYNALGQRVSKTAGSLREFYHYDETGQLIAVTNGSGKSVREYLYNGHQLMSFIAINNPAIPSITLAAASATRENVVLATTQTGYTGSSGYLQFNGEGQVTWPVTITANANYTISLRYSLAVANRPLTLWVDGVQRATVNFTATANWNTWATASTTLTLTAGSHSLSFRTSGSSGPNIDKATVAPASGQTGTPIPTTYYVHNDHLGTPQVVTNQAKQVVFMADYQPFGKLHPGQTNSIELYSRFPGQYVDSETGLYYNYFRDYDPSVGRYIESDPIGLGGGINTYAYTTGNPIKYIDPLGLQIIIPIPEIRPVIVPNPNVSPNPNSPHDWMNDDSSGSSQRGEDRRGEDRRGEDSRCPQDDKSCPPCNPPVGTVRYRVDIVPPSKPHYPHSGSHVHLYQMNQSPSPKCQCFWHPIGTTELPPPPNTSPM